MHGTNCGSYVDINIREIDQDEDTPVTERVFDGLGRTYDGHGHDEPSVVLLETPGCCWGRADGVLLRRCLCPHKGSKRFSYNFIFVYTSLISILFIFVDRRRASSHRSPHCSRRSSPDHNVLAALAPPRSSQTRGSCVSQTRGSFSRYRRPVSSVIPSPVYHV